MKDLRQIIAHLGAKKIADLCGVTVRAVYKWRTANALPRTEYTGETKYSELLAKALGNMTASQIRKISNPVHSVSET